MAENGIKHYVEVGEIIAAYYKDPDTLIERIRGK
jgi:hypothetical protein